MKGVVLLLVVFLMLQLVGGLPSLTGNNTAKAADIHEETYYIGGVGASDSNSGTDSTAPFATLAKAVQELNAVPGNYDIIVLGSTSEPQTSQIGDGVNVFNVNIKTVTGSAIVMRNKDVPGDLITVSNHTKLSLGDNDDTYSSTLTIDGGRTHFYDGVSYGTIIKVNVGGTLITYDSVVIQNIYRWTYSYNNYGGAIYNAGAFDMYGGTIQLCYASYGSGVYNSGVFKLYEGAIKENGDASYGSGVYNAASGVFEMFGGSITDNQGDSYAAGVGNEGIFRLSGGSIDNNYANSNGGVVNTDSGTIYMTGGSINNNRSDYSSGGIINSGAFYMSGGSVSGNTCTGDVGAFINYGSLEISGGTIENNVGNRGGAIHGIEESITTISGGLIQNNTAVLGGAVFNRGVLRLSGNAQIPAGTDSGNSIHLLSPLTIAGDITSTDSYAITLDNYSSAVGSQWIKEASSNLLAYYASKFFFVNSRYSIDDTGYVVSEGLPMVYYVGGENAADTNDGSQANPFATLEYAFKIGNDATSTFILQSDQVLTKVTKLKGNITIRSDGTSRKVINGATNIRDNLLTVESGSLTLGNSNNTDAEGALILDGMNERSNYGFLFNASTVNIYNGVIIRNLHTDFACIINEGTLNMYGGSIEYNTSEENRIVRNRSNFNMVGGTIRYNNGVGVYNNNFSYNYDEDLNTYTALRISGGSIYGNTAIKGAAVYHELGSFILSGSASFSKEGDLQNEIYMDRLDSTITIGGELTTTEHIIIAKRLYYDGLEMLDGEPSLIRSSYSKFKLDNPSYALNEQGKIKSSLPSTVYFVNALGNDTGTGGISDPYATIHKAVEKIGTGSGIIILQSDITIMNSVIVNGSVSIQSDGRVRNIIRAEGFKKDKNLENDMVECMFYVSGELKLGKVNGNDLNPDLFLNGNGSVGKASIRTIINNYGRLTLYPGVVIHNNITDRGRAGVTSREYFHMYGGTIRDNISNNISGVFISSGTFIMEGGTISNNKGSVTGAILSDAAFIMNGGSITGNIGESTEGSTIAGVYSVSSTATINGGSISNNNGTISGLVTERSRVYMEGGNVEDNIGTLAGIICFPSTTAYIKGGDIRNNNATLMGGVVLTKDSHASFSGGTVGGNIGGLSQGVFVMEDASLVLAGSALVKPDNKIIIQDWDKENAISIAGPLTSPLTAIIDIYYTDIDIYSEEVPEYTQNINMGRKLLESAGAYSFTWNDVSRLALAGDNYAINTAGRIGRKIKDPWVTLFSSKSIEYSGYEKTVYIEVKDEDTLLTEGVHYSVSYLNNIGVGTADVIIAGIGDYAGVVKQGFYIYDPYVGSGPIKIYRPNIPIPRFDWLNLIRQGTEDLLQLSLTISDEMLKSEDLYSIFLDKELVAAAKESGKDITIMVKDKNGKVLYTWTFTKENLENSLLKGEEMELALWLNNINSLDGLKKLLSDESDEDDNKDRNRNGFVISFGHSGDLPAQGSVRIYVGGREGVVSGSSVYLYYYNFETNKLETLPNGFSYIVDEEGYITIDILHCSDYVILYNEAKKGQYSSLRSQIKVTVEDRIIYSGNENKPNTTRIKVILPTTLELVKSFDDTASQSAMGKVTASYQSTDNDVATVDENGFITAKKEGRTTIITKLTLYNGKVKTTRTVVTVLSK